MGLSLVGIALLALGFGLFPQEPLRRLAEQTLREATSDASRLGGLRVVPMLLQAEVRDLQVETAGASLVVARGQVTLSPRALTEGAVFLYSLELDAPRLELRPTPPTPRSARPALLPPVRVDRVAIRDARVVWRDPETGGLELQGVEGNGSIGAGSLDLEVGSGRWTGDTPLEFGPAKTRLATTVGLDVTLERLDLRVGSSRLSAKGPLLRRAALAPRLEVGGSVDLADGGRLLGYPDLSGGLALSGRVEGDLDRLHATVELTGDPGYGEWRADGLEARGRWDGASRSGEVRLRARVLGGRLEGEARLADTRLQGGLRARGLDLGLLPPSAKSGIAAGKADVLVSWDGPLDGEVLVEARVDGDARGAAGSGRLGALAQGAVRPLQRSVDLDWSLRLAADATSAAAPGVELEGRGEAHGPLPPDVTGTFAGRVGFTAAEQRLTTDVAGSFDARDDRLRGALDARGPAGSVRIEGEVRADRLAAFSLHAEDVEIGLVAPGAAGRASLHVDASGPLRSPSLSLQAGVPGLSWQGTPLGGFEAEARGDPGRLEIEARLPELYLESEGELVLEPERRLRGRIRLEGTPLAPLSPLLAEATPLAGRLTATVTHDVPLERPTAGDVTVDVEALDVEHEGRSARARPFVLTLHGGRVTIEDLQLETPGLRAHARLETSLVADGPLELDATLTADLSSLPWPEGWSLEGSAGADIRVRGSRDEPLLDGLLRGDDLRVRGPETPEVGIDEARLPLGGDRLTVPGVTARVGDGRVTLEGEVPWAAVWTAARRGPLSPDDEARLSLRWEGVTLPSLEGSLAGELRVEGGLASIEEPRAVLTLPGARLRLEGIPVELAPATLSLEGGRVTTEGLNVGTGGGTLVVTGWADLLERTLDLRGRGRLALGVLSPLLTETALGGRADLDVALTGDLTKPQPSGTAQFEGVSLRLRMLPQAVTGLAGRIEFTGETARLEATGRLGGGSLQLAGEGQASAGTLGDLWLQLTGRDVALRYPPGLRSRLDVDLTLAGRPGDLVLAGDVQVQRGVYELEDALGEALRATVEAPEESELLRGVALDVRVDLVRPVLVRSNFGQLEATGRITARGDLQEPLPFGRLDVRRGGQIEVQGREFTVTEGALTYQGDWNAEALLRAEALVPDVEQYVDYRVRVALEGSLDEPSLSLSSEPSLSRQEIASLIATGRLNSPLVDTSAWLVGGQAATLLSGQLTRRVARSFGLDEITVRPDLVARDTDPSARFTFGKQFGRRLRLIYSAGLAGPERRFVEVEGRPGFDVALRAQRTDVGEHTFGAGQRFEWGAARRDEADDDDRVRLGEVRLEGDEALVETLRAKVRLSPGRRIFDWEVQDAADRLREELRRRGHLDAEVEARLEDDVAFLSVAPGPVYGWKVEGLEDPPDLDPVLRDALFEADGLDRGRERLLRELHARGHLRAEVAGAAREGEGERRWLVFTVTPGPRFETVEVRFPGARALGRSTLLDAAGGASGLLERPEAAVASLREAYRARHFLDVRIAEPRVEVSAKSVEIVVAVEEGAPARLVALRFEGTTLPEPELHEAARLPTGVVFAEAEATPAIGRVRGLYLSRGFADVRIRPELAVEGSDLALVLHVREGERRAVEEIALQGNDRTRDSLVRRALRLKPGAPLDPRRLADAERRLLNLGVFSRVAIVPRAEAPSSLDVNLEEGPNLTSGYDLRWNDDEGPSALVEGEARNLFGLGLAVGGRFRYGGDLREARGSLFLPGALTGGDVTASVFRLEEDFSEETIDITQIQNGFQVQQSVRLRDRWQLLAGYRFRRSTTLALGLVGEPIDVAGLDLSVLRNTRDDLLDPLEGSFLSLNLNVAPAILGSDAPLVKGYAEASLAHSFADAAFTWAHSYRLGLAWGFDDQPVLPSERFRAGGANSLRGLGTNELGPRGPLGDPAGGEAVVILNQELRYRHWTGMGAVVFYDAGNVFRSVRDMRLDLRQAVGVGLRWASPVGLLRMDVGFPLARQPEEKPYRLFFSLGQAF